RYSRGRDAPSRAILRGTEGWPAWMPNYPCQNEGASGGNAWGSLPYARAQPPLAMRFVAWLMLAMPLMMGCAGGMRFGPSALPVSDAFLSLTSWAALAASEMSALSSRLTRSAARPRGMLVCV